MRAPILVLVGVDGPARVLDFASPRLVGSLPGTTRDGRVKGKLAYMAPEQISMDAVDRRADVFAAAIVLWEALVGRPLFAHDGPARILDAILRDPIAAPSAVAGTPGALDEVVLRALERDRARRYPTRGGDGRGARGGASPVASRREVAAELEARLGPRIERRRALAASGRGRARGRRSASVGTPKRADALDPDATAPDALEPDERSAPVTFAAGDVDLTLPTTSPNAASLASGRARRRDGAP